MANEAYFDFWFSYCSDDKAQVQDLCDSLSSDKQTKIIKNKTEKGKLSTDLSNGRLLLHRYEWLEDESSDSGRTQTFRQVNGKRISQLVFDISNCYLRTVVLSEKYFLSSVCMQELCMCLCANIARAESKKVLPLISSKLANTLETLRGAPHNFKLPSGGKYGEKYYPNISLANALAKTHLYLRQKYQAGIPGYFFGEITKQDFAGLLEDMTDTLHYSISGSAPDECAAQTLDYALHVIRSLKDTGLAGNLLIEYKNLESSDFWKRLFSEHQQKHYYDQFEALKNISDAVKLLEHFESEIKNKPAVCNIPYAYERAEEFCSLVLLKIINPLYSTTRKTTDGIVTVNVAGETSLIHLNLLQAGIASAIAQHDHKVLAGCISPRASGSAGRLLGALPRQETPKDTCSGDVNQLLLNVIVTYLPEKKQQFVDNPEKAKQDARYWQEINYALEHASFTSNLPVILLQEGQDSASMGYYQVLAELNELLKITHNGEEKPAFSCIELRSPIPGNHGIDDPDSDQFALLQNRIYFNVKKSFSQILDLF